MIHPLRRWIFEHEETLATFAERIGGSQSYLSEVMRYKKLPSLDFVARVKEATNGDLSANDFLPPQRMDNA